jgi:hypothetical protein
MAKNPALSAPKASRPHMPGYGIVPADSGDGLLEWAWAVERLNRSRNYWIATARPDGRPHVAPVWGTPPGAYRSLHPRATTTHDRLQPGNARKRCKPRSRFDI